MSAARTGRSGDLIQILGSASKKLVFSGDSVEPAEGNQIQREFSAACFEKGNQARGKSYPKFVHSNPSQFRCDEMTQFVTKQQSSENDYKQ